MLKMIKKTLIVLIGLVLTSTVTFAQCAMCRATLENNVSNGDVSDFANINVGILYLFVFPYILIGTVAYLWYRKSKSGRLATG